MVVKMELELWCSNSKASARCNFASERKSKRRKRWQNLDEAGTVALAQAKTAQVGHGPLIHLFNEDDTEIGIEDATGMK